ncbi:hypothetical protein K474DRAFT_1659299 [Panus rudis PR-1116 ss-1]|nr:hypothetical protein K474DRAFT_1659299 [Panus rudis PR-1116 ss-1]
MHPPPLWVEDQAREREQAMRKEIDAKREEEMRAKLARYYENNRKASSPPTPPPSPSPQRPAFGYMFQELASFIVIFAASLHVPRSFALMCTLAIMCIMVLFFPVVARESSQTCRCPKRTVVGREILDHHAHDCLLAFELNTVTFVEKCLLALSGNLVFRFLVPDDSLIDSVVTLIFVALQWVLISLTVSAGVTVVMICVFLFWPGI